MDTVHYSSPSGERMLYAHASIYDIAWAGFYLEAFYRKSEHGAHTYRSAGYGTEGVIVKTNSQHVRQYASEIYNYRPATPAAIAHVKPFSDIER